MAILEPVTQNKQMKNSYDFSTLSGRESIFINLINQNPKIQNQLIYTLKISILFMKTEKEVEEFRKEIEQRLIDVSKLPAPDAAMKYYQGALRTLEWVVTGQDI